MNSVGFFMRDWCEPIAGRILDLFSVSASYRRDMQDMMSFPVRGLSLRLGHVLAGSITGLSIPLFAIGFNNCGMGFLSVGGMLMGATFSAKKKLPSLSTILTISSSIMILATMVFGYREAVLKGKQIAIVEKLAIRYRDIFQDAKENLNETALKIFLPGLQKIGELLKEASKAWENNNPSLTGSCIAKAEKLLGNLTYGIYNN